MLLRLASLVYHATVLCVSAPVLILYMYNIKWETSIVIIAERITLILANSSVMTLGSVYMINALKTSRTNEFLRKWHSFCTFKTEWIGDVDTKRFRKARIIFVLSTVSHVMFSLLITVKLSSLIEYSKQCETIFTLPNDPRLLKVACAIFMVMFNISSFSVSLTTCYFAFVTITFAEEFDKLHQVICNQAPCSCSDIGAWEQMRFRHEALGLPRVSTWSAVHHVAGSYPSREHHLPLLVTLLCCRSAYEWRHHHLRYHASSYALGHYNPSSYTWQYGEWNFHIEQMWQASLNTWPNYYLKLSDILTNVDTCSRIIKYRPM